MDDPLDGVTLTVAEDAEASASTQPALPPEAPLAMPVQDLRARPRHDHPRAREGARTWLARAIAFGGTGVIAVLGFLQMLAAFGDRPTPMQIVLLILFVPTFAWIGFSFCSTLAGLLARPITTPAAAGRARIAVIMPVYHEDAATSIGLLTALGRDMAQHEMADRAELFVLSDSRDPAVVVDETLAVEAARRLSPLPIWYRRRDDNVDRKSGNVADFVRRWGGRYDQMVVLDADSVLTGSTVAHLSARMEADPDLALIQTMPVLVGGETIFARLTQFAGRIYGPMIARGVAAWSGDTGNYWGHNAIIRVPAFAEACGLPTLSGRAPFGGSILSHDFVEAAALCRAGWKVRLDHDLRGSYEGCPPTLLDMAARERRWAQGNLQHLSLIGMRRTRTISGAHFAIGVMSFLMSPIWLALILVGLVLSATVLLSTPEYFPTAYQLFPDWPVFDARRMLWLFVAAMALLYVPKFVAIVRAWRRSSPSQAGGGGRVFASALVEIVLSALIAPVQMLIQTRQIFDILRGRDSGWNAQTRAGSMPGWNVVLASHWLHVALGLGTLIVLAQFSPAQLIWLSPILLGLILSPFTSRYSASPVLGRLARRQDLLVTPEERATPAIIAQAQAVTRRLPRSAEGDASILRLGRDPDLLKRHIAMLPPPAADRDLATRLPAITAEAKIAHAETQAQALSLLDRAETDALISDADLLQRWSRLPA
ncbi:glucans biosynthesis glucosyltransferase MdoH [Paracoccus sp. TK19116]|uniref:Glucans biosynthesis glucosyltransferase H n=1 Tax=Paracoccus albicereus TaxID=2922394 RepID=A0ABT1MV77_9RHOB|nr:glucans biosynthesis glucosyltransferase MdoH [Paracoccus albicereus]MCQ0972024.1 glucans biosynthesis glucosyltransferase MdoH [Paracoccus albicereus]